MSSPNYRDNPLEYRAWGDMKTRCFNPRFKDYHLYGGRGITVCARWAQSFVAFYADMGPKPTKLHTLDRENSNGNYEPGNCRWATRKEQARNWSTRNRLLAHNGQIKPLVQWAEEKGLPRGVIKDRLATGWSIADALETPIVAIRLRDEGGRFEASLY